MPSETWQDTRWMGVPTAKCPLDLWIYQEILAETRPQLVVETGTYRGGSALFLAQMCDLLGQGSVLTIDLEAQPDLPRHPRIRYLQGSSVADAVVEEVSRAARDAGTCLVILDSDHSRQHVARELSCYAPLVSPSSYLIVEDTNVNGHPVRPDFGPGPAEAVAEFLASNPGFSRDRRREKLLLTFNPGGYLRRRG